ncbi:hypothetical protein ACFFWD_18185 [Bradyrhizobium erythrophlei]|uniref:hypothetical protein n=1 Tax=Bradyrhizobium erythrophlei TaxID=1437360 RepID=UPI0035EA1B1B
MKTRLLQAANRLLLRVPQNHCLDRRTAMRTGWLLSASFVALISSLDLARADSFDDVASHLGAIEAAVPRDELSKTSTDSIAAVNKTVNDVNDAKTKAAAAAADLVKAQAAAGIGNLPPDQAYQAQANKVATQLDVIDGLKKMADSGNIKKNLDEAVANQKTAEYWANRAAQSVKDTANLPATDPKRKEALDGYDNANKLMAKAQYLAGVAADAAKAALNDPKSVESQLRAKIQGATADYNDMKSSLDKLNNVKNATVALQRANDDVTALKSVAVAKGVAALNAVNADMQKAEEAKKAAAATPKPVASSSQPPALAVGSAVSSGGPPPLAGSVVSQGGGGVIAQGGGNLIAQGGGNLIAQGGGNAIAQGGGNLIAQGGGNLIAQGGGNLIAQGGGNLIGQDGAGFVLRGPAAYKAVGPTEHETTKPETPKLATTTPTSAMLHIVDVAAPAPTHGSNTATGHTTYLMPTEQLAAGARNNLSASDQKILNGMIADVKAGKTLTPAQETQAATLLNQAAKGLDPATVKSLQQTATVKAAVANANTAVAATVVNQAVAAAKNDPAVVAAVQNLQSGKPLTPSQQASLNTAISSVVNNLPVSDAQKQNLTQTAATQVATAPQTALAPAAAPAVDMSAYTPAMVQQMVTAGPTVIQGLQSQQAAALAKGDKTMAEALGRDITSLQGQIDTAKKIAATTPAAPAATPAGSATAAAKPTAPAVATPTASTPAAVATAAPAATPAGSPAAAPVGTTPATPSAAVSVAATSKTDEAPARITAEQGKAVQQALRTIPGKLTKAEEKNFSVLSALVDRARTKALTPEEAATLRDGLKALAEKHPKAERQHGLTAFANTVAVGQKPAVAATTPAGGGGPAANPTANASPDGKSAPGSNAVAGNQSQQAHVPGHEMTKPEAPKLATTTPAAPANATTPKQGFASPNPAERSATTMPVTTSHQQGHVDEAKPRPTAPKAPVANMQATRSEPKPQPAARAPQVTAPKPSLASSSAAPKPPAAPAAKPQTCTPNMVNGKMMGMTCR